MTRFLHSLPTVFIAVALGACGRVAAAEPPAKPITAHPNSDIFVHKVGPLLDGGRSVDWSWTNNRLLVGKQGVNKYFNVYSITPEGFRLKCLTLGRDPGNYRHHSGNGAWYPTGEYYVFVSQNRGSSSYRMSLPGTGLNCNVWLADSGGERFWQLTDVKTSTTTPQGVVSPYFSPDGSRLFWSGNTGEYPLDSAWGRRAMYLAEFAFDRGSPKLTEVQTLQPGEQKDFYESHGFSPDGARIVFSANLGRAQSAFGMDICTMDLRTSRVTVLTDSPDVWDEYASYSPDGRKIVYMSSAGQDVRFLGGSDRWSRYLRSELWIMDADGGSPRQLTFFNTRGAPEFIGRRCFVADSAWSPDGSRIAMCVNYESRNFDLDTRIVVLDLGIGPPVTASAGEEGGSGEGAPGTRDGRLPRQQPVAPGVPLRW